jgi:hypothetical protein
MERDGVHAGRIPGDNEEVLLKKFTLYHRNITINLKGNPMNANEPKEPCCGTDCCSSNKGGK